MIDLAKLDKNFEVSHTLAPEQREQLNFFDIDEAPFSICGVFREGDHYVRMPAAVSETVSERVHVLASYTAGGRIRFVTNSRRIAVHAECFDNGGMCHFAFSGISGFDLYAEWEGSQRYYGTCLPPIGFHGGFEKLIELPSAEQRTITINMPLYNGVHRVLIGLDKGSTLLAAPPLPGPPVVYYGSSITQGGCASRPGSCYQAMVHRQLQMDYVNLGFSGSAQGEETMLRYIASLPVSAFVYDYDHNAPSLEHLEATHERGFRIVREAHPTLPVIFLTRPKYYLSEVELQRNAVIRRTYENALAAGDRNVYFIDGRELLAPDTIEHALVDNTHPTDLGFYGMARRLLPELQRILQP